MELKREFFGRQICLHWESLIHRSLNSFSLSFHNFLFFNFYSHFQIPILIFISEISAWRLVFWLIISHSSWIWIVLILRKSYRNLIINSLFPSSFFFSLISFIQAFSFISLQIKEFRIMSLSINDSVYSCVFFFLTGLHFFHLSFGLFLSCLLFWSCSFPFHFFSFQNLSMDPEFFYSCLSFWPRNENEPEGQKMERKS